MWTFKCIIIKKGKSPIEDWYHGLSPRAQSRLDRVLEYLEDRPQADWDIKYFKQLTKAKGICEIRFFVDKVQHRPLVIFSPLKRHELVFVLPAIEKGGKFVPKDAINQAVNRAKKLSAGEYTVKEFVRDEEID